MQISSIFLEKTVQLRQKHEIIPLVLACCLRQDAPVLADHVLVQQLCGRGRDTTQLQILMERLLQVLIQLTARTNNQRTVSKELIQVFGFTEIKLSKDA
jgi:hypothetical protein